MLQIYAFLVKRTDIQYGCHKKTSYLTFMSNVFSRETTSKRTTFMLAEMRTKIVPKQCSFGVNKHVGNYAYGASPSPKEENLGSGTTSGLLDQVKKPTNKYSSLSTEL